MLRLRTRENNQRRPISPAAKKRMAEATRKRWEECRQAKAAQKNAPKKSMAATMVNHGAASLINIEGAVLCDKSTQNSTQVFDGAFATGNEAAIFAGKPFKIKLGTSKSMRKCVPRRD